MSDKELNTKYKILNTKLVPKRILITRTDRLGDVVLSTPVIKHMRKLFPDAYIAFMVQPSNREVVINNPHLDEVIVYDKCRKQKSLWSTVRFALSLKKKNFDTAIALHPTNRVHIMMFAAGIPRRIGYDRKLPWLLTERVAHKKQAGTKHEVDFNLDLLESSGFDISQTERTPYMETSENDKRVIDSVMKDHGLKDNIIAIHAGASCPSKRWAPENFAAVADKLTEKYGSKIVFVGGDETSEFSRAAIAGMRTKATDLTGMLQVGELAELLSRCRGFVSNDSGPVHVAVSVKTPVVAIFGRNDPGLSPRRWGPLGSESAVLHKDPGCGKCLAHNCEKEFACLKAITPEDVLSAAQENFGE
ncbi:MAG: lipopolysaccharide heptosyltransferase II [Candidatus Tantalella remota]|nr:lipopolysaccharide heptosyltransferase II [Candidatus Tantalella remota]